MFFPFASMSPASRIWIFQADRPLTANKADTLADRLHTFTQAWAAHGNPLKTSFTIKYNQFIILAADEGHQQASGCSIDSAVRVIKEIEELTGTHFLDKNQVAFKINGNILMIPLQHLKQNFLDGMWDEATLTFNNLIDTKSALEDQWLVPAGKTWLKRYIPNEFVKLK